MGILACCISGFVTANRFGFAINGSYCSFERFYYDSKFGQLKDTYPKWEGFTKMKENLELLEEFVKAFNTSSAPNISDILVKGDDGFQLIAYPYNNQFMGYFTEDFVKKLFENKTKLAYLDKIQEKISPITENYKKIVDSTYNLQNLNSIFKSNIKDLQTYFVGVNLDFDKLKTQFIEDFYHYAGVANGWCRILTTIYFSLLLIATTFACVSMMFYSCLRRQGYLSIFMHVLWNIIRFFMFSFFMYGAAYGIFFKMLRDAVIFVKFVFGEDNLKDINTKSLLIPTGNGKDYLNYCLINNNDDYKNRLNNILTSSLEDFFRGYLKLLELFNSQNQYSFENLDKELNEDWEKMYKFMNKTISQNIWSSNNTLTKIAEDFSAIAKRKGGLFGSYDCSFLKGDLHMMYRTVYDAAIESRILCALSCCIGFFGAIAVYFFLLVIHHYDNELFYDAGQSNFIGFEGFGYKRNDIGKNPAYKKRKIRSEIELSSRNDQYSGN